MNKPSGISLKDIEETYSEKIRFLEREIKRYEKPLKEWRLIKPNERMFYVKKDYEEIIRLHYQKEIAEKNFPELVKRFNYLKSRFESILNKFLI